MTKSTKQRLLAVEDDNSDTFCVPSGSRKPRRSLARGMSQRMPSMKKLTSIRNLMGGTSNQHGATLLEDVCEDDMNESFNISFRDLNKGKCNDDSALEEIHKNEDFSNLANGKGLQFHPEHGLQFDPMLGGDEEEDASEEEDLFQSKQSAVSRRNQLSKVQSRRQLTSSRQSLRRSSSSDGADHKTGAGVEGRSSSRRMSSSSGRTRPRRSVSGDGTTTMKSRRSSERSKRRPTVTRSGKNKDKETTKEDKSRKHPKKGKELKAEQPVVEDTSTEEESMSSASAADHSMIEDDYHDTQQQLEATPEEAPMGESSTTTSTNRRSSTRASMSGSGSRRPKMMHRAESVRGTLSSFSDQGKSTRKLEASKRDTRPSIRVSKANGKGKDKDKKPTTTTSKDKPTRTSSRSSTSSSNNKDNKDNKESRRSSAATERRSSAMIREPSRRVVTLNDAAATKESKGTGLQW